MPGEPESIELGNKTTISTRETQCMKPHWLKWSVFSCIIFLPLFIFWLPALYYSLCARYDYRHQQIQSGSLSAKRSLLLNTMCLIFGLIMYLQFAILFPLSFLNNFKFHIAVVFIPPSLVFILHLIRIILLIN